MAVNTTGTAPQTDATAGVMLAWPAIKAGLATIVIGSVAKQPVTGLVAVATKG